MIDVIMPQMGESIVEGTLTRWLKKPGDRVERDEPLFEISTDKVDTEVPSPAAGVLSELLAQEGQTVSVNAIVARISDGAAAPAPAPVVPAPAPPAPAPVEAALPPAPAPAPAPAANAGGAAVDVVMPQMGESIVEGTLTKWLKKPGDAVNRDEPLFEVSTDKVDTEVPAPAAGVLGEILVQEGSVVAVNAIVARITTGEAPAPAPQVAAPAPVPAAVAPAPVPAPAAAPAPAAEPQGPLSPLVRKMAREFSIDLGTIAGTGAGGRITKQDVEGYMAQQGARTLAAPAPVVPAPVAPAPPAPAPAAQAITPPAPAAGAKSRVEPMSIMRQKIAEHMVMSKTVSAHVTTVHRVDMTKIVKARDKAKTGFQERYGFGLTFLPFIARAAAEGLRAFPVVNASIDPTGKSVIYHNEINLGIAVALDGGAGLIVPVIRNADEKNVTGLQRDIVDLANRARSKQLKPAEVQGGTFSITNFGSFGSLFATPVINQPQVAILGCGAITKEPVVIDDAIAIRSMMYLALTFDHRLIDGALADQYCQKVKAVLEGWSEQVL
jgi:2-oxoglutarate dehydrogenase E2 component (dihydrolipoamide succinyltransferase)